MVKLLLMSYLQNMITKNQVVSMKFLFVFVFAALSAMSQTNLASIPNVANASSSTATQTFQSQTNQALSNAERIRQVRAVCIQNRRSICGKILKILPDGLVVESGYTNLLRVPINRSWLAPGTVTANPAPGLIEKNEPASVCVGQVFLTDYPKSRRLKPKVFDYVIIEGYPAGQYTYASIGNVQRTVRKFSAALEKAVDFNLQAENKNTSSPGS